ncbi:MAG: hypothetical protein J6A06_01780 [Fibrobacteraceae bacterium]|nr:hypothetical protein [Fibrobacteraceae bacterium]
MDKRNFFQKAGTCFALIVVIDVVLIELGIAPMPFADYLLTAMIVLLAISLAGSFYFKEK